MVRDLLPLERKQFSVLFPGPNTGNKFYDNVRGEDDTPFSCVIAPPNSISVCILWGVRFDHIDQVKKFLADFNNELVHRMGLQSLRGKSFTFSLYLRKNGYPKENPHKYLGEKYST